jgi:hypothetical protein
MTEQEREDLELKRILGNLDHHAASNSKINLAIHALPDSQKVYQGKPCRTCGNPYRYVNTNACTLRDRHP